MPTSTVRAAVAAVVLFAAAACSRDGDSSHRTPAPPVPAPQLAQRESRIAADLPMLAGDLNLGARPAEEVRSSYEFAARHPEVLKYVPCFCGCERAGHQGNDDCFVSSRTNGKVTAWETHGLVCEICIDVAQQAMRMFNTGASVTAIRDAIDKRYAGRPTHTPTPTPPARTGKGNGH